MKGYEAKINAFNHILEGLRIVQPDGCEFKAPTDVMFHRNDPELMNPDVILARKQAIVSSQNGGHLDPTRAPFQPFDWSIIDLTVKSKCYKKTMDPPPACYSASLSLYVPVVKDVRKPLKTNPIPDPGESRPLVKCLDEELDVQEENEGLEEDEEVVELGSREDDEVKEGEEGEEESKEGVGEEDGGLKGNTTATCKSLTADVLNISQKKFRYPQLRAFTYGRIRILKTETALVGDGRHSFKEIKTYDTNGHHADCTKCAPCFWDAEPWSLCPKCI